MESRTVRRTAAVAAALGVVACVEWAVDIGTRPPCPERYVRLIDVEPILLVISAVLTTLAGGTWWRHRRPRPVRGGGWIVAGLLLLAAVTLASAALGGSSLAAHYNAAFDEDCWTF